MTKYNKELLEECLKRDNATLIGDYEKLTSRTDIIFKCNCGEECKKRFSRIYEGGFTCGKCSRRISKENYNLTMGNTIYNIDLLKECIIRDKSSLLGEYKNLTSSTNIKFICGNCGKDAEKTFYNLHLRGGCYCSRCVKNKVAEIVNRNNNKLVYNMDLLLSCIDKDNALLLGDYPILTNDTNINYKCNCGIECSYIFRRLYKHGAVCNECEKDKNGVVCYNKKLLDKCMERDNASIEDEYNKLYREISLKFKCSCGNEWVKTFRRIHENGAFCNECNEKNKRIKTNSTNLERYGTTCSLSAPLVKDKVKAINLERRGVEYPTQCKEVKDKVKATNLERLGVEYPTQSKEVMKKVKATNLERLGVEYTMQSSEVMEKQIKSSYSKKEYTFPSGNKIKVQGYEPLALDILINKWKVEENDIITERTKVPEIWWKDKEDKSHRYYPDIFIPSKNLIIEVKSTWTYQKDKSNTQYKLIGSKELGYSTLLWVFDNKKYLEDEYKDCYFEEE